MIFLFVIMSLKDLSFFKMVLSVCEPYPAPRSLSPRCEISQGMKLTAAPSGSAKDKNKFCYNSPLPPTCFLFTGTDWTTLTVPYSLDLFLNRRSHKLRFVKKRQMWVLMYNTSMVSFDGGSASKVDDVIRSRAVQDGGYALLWQRYDNNKMAAICYSTSSTVQS